MRKKALALLLSIAFVVSAIAIGSHIIHSEDVAEIMGASEADADMNELVCMLEGVQRRLDLVDERFERRTQEQQQGIRESEMSVYQELHVFSEEERQELYRQTMLLRELSFLTHYYNNPESDFVIDDIVNFFVERGHTSYLEELNNRRTLHPIPPTLPYIQFVAPAGEYFWDFFLIDVSHIPTRGCIEFILSYTGIPREIAYIVYGEGFIREEGEPGSRADFEEVNYHLLPYSYEDEQKIQGYDEFGYRFLPDDYMDAVLNSPTWAVGSMIFIRHTGNFTLGHPRDASGTSFFTSVHNWTTAGEHAAVFCVTTGRYMGHVMRVMYGNGRDVAEVRVQIGQVSTAGILNFRGTARVNDSVRSRRGVSGTRFGYIFMVNAWVDSVASDMILAGHPQDNRVQVPGDSGAALIGTINSAVLGTRRGIAWERGVYSKVTNYR